MKVKDWKVRTITRTLALVLISQLTYAQQWSEQKANNWYAKLPWLAGCNYTPAYAINQLEFWQQDTFNPDAIEREMTFAENTGFNTMRVFLHDLAWKQDPEEFKGRINQFLNICAKHKIKPSLVFFDDCWNENAAIGKQPEPKPGTHNSGWLRSPSKQIHDDPSEWGYLKEYVQDILRTFKNDERILLWDLYNEPGNSGYENSSLPLVKAVFSWAREINPSQPLTVVMFEIVPTVAKYSLEHSDVISYHNYGNAKNHQGMIDSLKNYNRPLFCTEYMARPLGSTFMSILPMLKAQKIAAINWGFVDGKTQTKYQWGEVIADGSDPDLWFHDVLRKDGTPYLKQEVELIKQLTGKKGKPASPRYFNYQVSKAGSLKTIKAAATLASPGDTITVHGGVYREYVDPKTGGTAENRRIVYRVAKNEKVIIKGSEIIKDWKKSGPFWQATLPDSFFGKYNPYREEIKGDWFDDKGWKQHTGAVYLNGKWLMECRNKIELSAMPNHWYAEADKDSTRIWANFGGADPRKELTEINVRKSCFYPAKTAINYITVSGFTISQAATNWSPPTAEQIGAIGTNWSKGWIIENCDIGYSKCAGITLGKYSDQYDNTSANSAAGYIETVKRAIDHGWNKSAVGGHIVRNNTISFCEQAGIVGSLGCAYSLIENNTIHDIHMQRLFSGAEQAAIKFHGAVDVIIKNNKIFHNNRGIWLDWMAQGARISANLLYDHDDWDTYFEVDHGPILLDNNIMLSANSQRIWSQGVAYVHNLIAGKFEVWPYDNRETPLLAPHGTEITGFKDNPSGDVQLYHNIFSGENCITESFGATKLRSKMNGNLYLNGAKKASIDKNGLSLHDPVDIRLNRDSSLVDISFPSLAITLKLQLLNSDFLGKTAITNQSFSSPDGKPIPFDVDFFGKKRTGQILPGPYTKYKHTK
ncbi:right-handed parallel beta-helix repeat-containing protein [Pedobacter paludis]|uniref:Right handed beta helix domain-containing protein n=1 Tax=Pedobacter paludis TaxID=2203212 RepID=A0A317F1K0_9SPHI|nr:right-handed parallel beta-helix repeat-containing protein [Pedobacter paludis]PWS32645.1 hypothetical protein DF947_06120 [Pedobacter paludis]